MDFIITSESDYELALKRLEEIFDSKQNTPEGEEASKLVDLILEWENNNHKL